MRARDKNARDTRWLYRQEATTFKFNTFANEERPMEFLHALAQRIWRAEAPVGRRMPEIRAGNGTRHGGAWSSYCAGFTEIMLARHHRNVLVLIHELVHALGPCQHGKKFVKLYFRLLHKWAGYNRWFLQSVAAERGIAL